MTPSSPAQHRRAVLGIALVATIWGASFAAMRLVLQSGLSVGALLSFRFTLGAFGLGTLALLMKAKWGRRDLIDGLLLGAILSVIFWLQTDGLRYTSTSKSAFITGLYVIFTPMVSLVVGDKLRPSHALGALLASGGLYFLVHEPGKPLGGWTFGDTETLLCAVLCGAHISMTAHFSRRSDGWVLATMQILVVALVSWILTPLVPAQTLADGTRLGGFSGAFTAVLRPQVFLPLLYLALLATTLAFYLMATLQAHLGATEAAIIYSLEPVFGALLAVSALVPGIHEHLSRTQVLGGALILGAMLLAELGPRLLARDRTEEAIG